MTTLPPENAASRSQLHTARSIAESFGTDPAGYDRARPGYPDELVSRIVAESSGTEILDVGCGTGIASRQFQAAGCTVLGVEPDPRMAEFARERGLPVEVSTFEQWDPLDRTFDAVVAAQSWHWVEPAKGASKAARILRPGGVLAIFSHVYEPPAEIAEPLAAAVRRFLPDSFFANVPARRGLDQYRNAYERTGDTIRETGHFAAPEVLQFDWARNYSRNEWLELLPTTGGLTQVEPGVRADILAEVGAAIDELGGSFLMEFTTLAILATDLLKETNR